MLQGIRFRSRNHSRNQKSILVHPHILAEILDVVYFKTGNYQLKIILDFKPFGLSKSKYKSNLSLFSPIFLHTIKIIEITLHS